jgi:hypothetical protein
LRGSPASAGRPQASGPAKDASKPAAEPVRYARCIALRRHEQRLQRLIGIIDASSRTTRVTFQYAVEPDPERSFPISIQNLQFRGSRHPLGDYAKRFILFTAQVTQDCRGRFNESDASASVLPDVITAEVRSSARESGSAGSENSKIGQSTS